jgi:hypothetical protein
MPRVSSIAYAFAKKEINGILHINNMEFWEKAKS